MIRYFISYNKLDKKNIDNKNVWILKKDKEGNYKVLDISDFKEINDIIKNRDKLMNKGLFIMYELNKDEVNNYNPIDVKEFKDENNKLNFIEKDINLINYNTFNNINSKDISLNELKFVELDTDKNDNITLKNVDDDMYFVNRNKLTKKSIIGDIYFYTENESLIKKYKNDITLIKEININTYKLIRHKVFIIESVSQNYVYDFNFNSMRIFYDICNRSIPVSIENIDYEKYELINKLDKNKKKVYLIKDFNINNIIYDNSILPLLKYMYVLEYEKDGYKKINLEEYMKRENILKYIKKPS